MLDNIIFIVFVICLLVQVAHIIFYFSKILTIKSSDAKRVTSPVSIVIAARNEAQNLQGLLDTLLAQVYSEFEIIVVNDRSEDDSSGILRKYQSQHTAIRIIEITELPKGWNGKKHALLKGIEAANHDIILLTDADCLPDSKQWIATMTNQFVERTKFVVGFSRYEEHPGFLNHFIRFETLWTAIQYLSMAALRKPYMAVGRNLAYQKSSFLKYKFEGVEDLTGGDDDLFINRFGTNENTEVQISPDSITTSIPKKTWSSYFKQKIRHLSVGKYYHKKDRTRIGLFALCNLSGWILLFYLLLTGFNPLLILTLFGLRSILFYIIFTRTGQKLGVRIFPLALPMLDLFFNLFHLVAGFRALTAKRIKWS